MPNVKAVTGGSFIPTLVGGVAAPMLGNLASGLPIVGSLGPFAPLAASAALAYFGKGAMRQAGQGGVLTSTVALVGPMLSGGLASKAPRGNESVVMEAF